MQLPFAMQFGNLAEWAAALLTAGTLLLGLLLFKREQDGRRIDQARRISAWPAEFKYREGVIELGAFNGSHEPAYDVFVNIHVLERSSPFVYGWVCTWHIPFMAPSQEMLSYSFRAPWPLPKESANPPLTISGIVLTVSFNDAGGVSWARRPDGNLRQVKAGRLGRLLGTWLVARFGRWPPRRGDAVTRRLSSYIMVPRVWILRDKSWRYQRHPDGHDYHDWRSKQYGLPPLKVQGGASEGDDGK